MRSGSSPMDRVFLIAGVLFVVGIVLFSGSLYALSLGAPRWLGAITPFGGMSFLLGWLALAWTAWRNGAA